MRCGFISRRVSAAVQLCIGLRSSLIEPAGANYETRTVVVYPDQTESERKKKAHTAAYLLQLAEQFDCSNISPLSGVHWRN